MKNRISTIRSIKKEKIDISKWQEYVIGDIFKVLTSKYTDPKKYKKGNVPYIGRSSNNNGVTYFIEPFENQELFEGNSITIGAEGCVAFYQRKDYLTGNKIYRLYSPYLNKKNALFIIPILNEKGKEYSYSNAWVSEKIRKDKIKLPSKWNNESGFEPDWEYMENYISDLENQLEIQKIEKQINELKLIGKEYLDISEWKDFVVNEIFTIVKNPKWLNKSDMKPGSVPVVSNTEKNNGISNYVDIDFGIHNNKITVSNNGSVGETFYHPYDFYSQSGISILDIKDESIKLNKDIAMFLIPVIKHIGIKYNYGRKLESSLLSKEVVKLPSIFNPETNEYQPDWEYMESYIKSLPYS